MFRVASRWSKVRGASLTAQAVLYLAAGVNHLWHPQTYLAIMPPHYAHPAALIQLSGWAEIAGGAGLLVPVLRRAAAWGIIAMLVVYLDVHVFMASHPHRWAPIPAWAVYARIPIQLALIAWAAAFARPAKRI
jgi:uncharacterized membrane protein